jgi:predicted RNA-binding Zn-ribbon protein involved in translation (DUF1610 family)
MTETDLEVAQCAHCGEAVIIFDHPGYEATSARTEAKLPSRADVTAQVVDFERKDGTRIRGYMVERNPTGFDCPGCGQANPSGPEEGARQS